MTIRSATINDIPDIVRIYDGLISLEEIGSGKTGWIRGIYPTIDTAYDALKENSLFVGFENETIVGSARINKIQPDIYKIANWITSASDNEVMVLHTLSINLYTSLGYKNIETLSCTYNNLKNIEIVLFEKALL